MLSNICRWVISALIVFSGFLPLSAQAISVEVVGQAPLAGSAAHARQQALDDAMRQASLRAGAQISSTQLMSQGVIEQDDVAVRSHSQIKNVEVLWEDQLDGLYQIAIRADVSALAMCPKSTQRYRKAIAVTGFGVAQPMQTSVGQLHNVERALPRLLVSTLNDRGATHAMDASLTSLYANPHSAPAGHNSQQRLTTSVSLATQLGAQYVISGVVRDLSLLSHSDQLAHSGPGLTEQWLDLWGIENTDRRRRFVVDVFVHDGLSGALLFQRAYQTSGQWQLASRESVGFATAQFWQTGYGHKVRNLLSDVVDDLDEVLRCQPFMARVVKARGNRLHIEASAGAGIRPGDKFQVFRTGTFYNLDLEPRTELSDMATEVVVRQVQPQFVIAEMQSTAEHLAIQRDDMVIAW